MDEEMREQVQEVIADLRAAIEKMDGLSPLLLTEDEWVRWCNIESRKEAHSAKMKMTAIYQRFR